MLFTERKTIIKNARIKLFKSAKLKETENKQGFTETKFETWLNNHKNEAQILKDEDDLCFERVGHIMFKLLQEDSGYEYMLNIVNIHNSLWITKLHELVEDHKHNKSTNENKKSSKNINSSPKSSNHPNTYDDEEEGDETEIKSKNKEKNHFERKQKPFKMQNEYSSSSDSSSDSCSSSSSSSSDEFTSSDESSDSSESSSSSRSKKNQKERRNIKNQKKKIFFRNLPKHYPEEVRDR